MSYLRFSRDDYRTLSCVCQQLHLGPHPRPYFKRLLVEALESLGHDLTGRIARLRGSELKVLHDHFRERDRPKTVVKHDLTPIELRTLLEACVSAPFAVRFVRPFKRVLVEMLEEPWPELAGKLARLSGQQFERLYEQAQRQRRGRA